MAPDRTVPEDQVPRWKTMIDSLSDVLGLLRVAVPALIISLALSGISLFVLWGQNNSQSDEVHKLQRAVTDQREIIQDQANRITTANSLFCAQGKFLGALIQTSLNNPTTATNPSAVTQIRAELADLNKALAGCPA